MKVTVTWQQRGSNFSKCSWKRTCTQNRVLANEGVGPSHSRMPQHNNTSLHTALSMTCVTPCSQHRSAAHCMQPSLPNGLGPRGSAGGLSYIYNDLAGQALAPHVTSFPQTVSPGIADMQQPRCTTVPLCLLLERPSRDTLGARRGHLEQHKSIFVLHQQASGPVATPYASQEWS